MHLWKEILTVAFLQILFTEACNRLYPAKPQGGNPSARGQPGAWSFVGAYMIYFFGYLVLNMLVVVLKVTTGQLRPHFFAVCKPDYDQSQCTGWVKDTAHIPLGESKTLHSYLLVSTDTSLVPWVNDASLVCVSESRTQQYILVLFRSRNTFVVYLTLKIS